jgi:hypothetical protein
MLALILQIVAAVVTYLPQLLKVVQAIIDFIGHLHKTDPAAAKEMLGDLKTAVKAARQGDPVPMQVLSAKVTAHCEGSACTKG